MLRVFLVILVCFVGGCDSTKTEEKDAGYLSYLTKKVGLSDEPLHLQGAFGLDFEWCEAANGKNYKAIMECYNRHEISGGYQDNWHQSETVSVMDDAVNYGISTRSAPYSISGEDYRTDGIFVICNKDGWSLNFTVDQKILKKSVRVRIDKDEAFIMNGFVNKPVQTFKKIENGKSLLLEYSNAESIRISKFDITNIKNEVQLLKSKCGIK